MSTKTSWWYLKIDDYPNYKPNDADLEHIAECIKQGYDNGELIQEEEDEDDPGPGVVGSANDSSIAASSEGPVGLDGGEDSENDDGGAGAQSVAQVDDDSDDEV